mmetsp:Transcript_27918/g.40826  ORF Transcript_27918/g.40826 Transcript_27918/m.40826 type:complete len:230 (-) Transcript_27918:562-1251(-)
MRKRSSSKSNKSDPVVSIALVSDRLGMIFKSLTRKGKPILSLPEFSSSTNISLPSGVDNRLLFLCSSCDISRNLLKRLMECGALMPSVDADSDAARRDLPPPLSVLGGNNVTVVVTVFPFLHRRGVRTIRLLSDASNSNKSIIFSLTSSARAPIMSSEQSISSKVNVNDDNTSSRLMFASVLLNLTLFSIALPLASKIFDKLSTPTFPISTVNVFPITCSTSIPTVGSI